MADKVLNSRIQQKHDIEVNWLKATNFVPKVGEIIVYDPDENYNYSRIKTGDGISNINNLPFINTTYDLAASTSSANGNVKLNLTAGGSGSGTDSVTIKGSGATTVTTDANGIITISSTDTDTNTDTKVTSAANHYTPAADTSALLSVDASSSTAATWNSTSLVTGVNLQRDAKGHVTGVTVDSIKMPANPNSDTNTTYDLTSSKSSTNGNVQINLVAGGSGSGTDSVTIKGAGSTTVTTDANGVISVTGATIPTTLKNPNVLKFGSKTYDGSAEKEITAADLGLSSAMKFLGTSATAITDGATTNPIIIGSTSTTVTAGNVVLYGSKEFVWNGSKWEELGNEGSYKVVQDAVSSPSASGNATAFIDTISQDTNGKITVTKKNVQFPTAPSLSGGSAAANDATVAGGVTVSGHAVTVPKKTIKGGSNVTVTGGTSEITISATDTTYGAATQSAAGLMSAADKKKLDGIASGATANTGDITGVTAGNGLTGGGTSGSVTLNVGAGTGITVAADTVSAKLRSTTALTVDSAAATTTSGRVYPVAPDKSGYLAVNVPWTDTDTKYTLPNATSSTLGGVKIGSNVSISNGTISVPTASGTAAGVTLVYPAASCTTFSSDSGTVTPLAVQKGAKMFAITRPPKDSPARDVIAKRIARWKNDDGDLENTMITIEDVTNSKDSSKKAQVITIPAEGNKKMVYGYCTDQVDGTSFIGGVFDQSATSYPYNAGLAIGGTSGNLLWKGSKVISAADLAAGSTPGVVKTTSTVTSTSGLTACPIISGVPYYKDTKYTHPTTSGNKHIPSGGSSGQILKWSANGTAVWSDNSAAKQEYTVALGSNDWYETDDGTFVQMVTVNGISGSDTVIVDLETSLTPSLAEVQAFGEIVKINTTTNMITAYSFTKPTVNITIKMLAFK